MTACSRSRFRPAGWKTSRGSYRTVDLAVTVNNPSR